MEPGFVQVIDEALIAGRGISEGPGMGAGYGSKSVRVVTYWSLYTEEDLIITL